MCRGRTVWLLPAVAWWVLVTDAVAATVTVGNGPGFDYGSVQAAIDAALDGDTISVAGGVFAGSLDLVGRELSIVGAGRGVTRLDIGCDGWIVLDEVGPETLIADLTVYADCPGGLGPGLFGVTNSRPRLERLAVIGVRSRPFVDIRGPPTGAGGSDVLIRDLAVEQIQGACPDSAVVAVRDLHGEAHRVLVLSRCGGRLELRGSVTVDGALVQDRGALEAVFAGDPEVTLKHATVTQSPTDLAFNQIGLSLNVDFPPAVRSTVVAGSSAAGVGLFCVVFDGPPVDLKWSNNAPADGGALLYYDDDLGVCSPYLSEYPLGEEGNISAPPQFIDWTQDGLPNDNLCPAPGSPLLDAGDPDELDLDAEPVNDFETLAGII